MEKELNLNGDAYLPSPPGTTPLGFTPEKEERTIAERMMVSIPEKELDEYLTRKETPLDKQVGGSHYKRFKIQPIEFCQINKLDACQSNVIKYICRHEFKDGIKDLEKAKHYIDLLIQMEYSNESSASK